MLVDDVVGRSEGRQAVGSPNNRSTGADGDEQRQVGLARPRILHRLGEVQGGEEKDGGYTGADGGLGHGHIDGIEHDQHARHQEAVDAGEHDHAEQVARAHDANRDGGEQGQQHHVDESFYGCLPSLSRPSSRSVRSSASCGLTPACRAA